MLNDKGFNRPTYDEILTEQMARAKALFGDDIETSELTALGKFIRLNVYEFGELYELLEYVYYARFPNTATGISLDRLCLFAGLTRNPATSSIHKVKIYGESNSVIEAGNFTISTLSGITFYLLNSVTLTETSLTKDLVINDRVIQKANTTIGVAEALFECVDVGEIGNVKVGAITNIVTPDNYVKAIKHIGIDTVGTEIETDVSLRNRFKLTITGIGSGTIDSIYGAIWRVEGVAGCYIIENDTAETVDNRPSKSFECYVLGGSDDDVANAIFSKIPIGIETVTTVTEENQRSITIEDSGGTEHTINFSRTIEKPIYFKLNINVNTHFEETGIDDIKNNIIQHLAKLTNGDNVIYSSLFSDVHTVEGVVSVTIQISDDNEMWQTADISVAGSEVARTDTDKITVTRGDYVDN